MVPLDSKSDLPLSMLLKHMHKKYEINWTKLKGGCQSGKKVVPHDSKSDLPLRRHTRLSTIRSINFHVTLDVAACSAALHSAARHTTCVLPPLWCSSAGWLAYRPSRQGPIQSNKITS